MNYVKYEHYGNTVAVREDLMGKHREHCLCWKCQEFHPEDRENSCKIANEIYSLCVKHGLVTPVWECPHFKEMK